MRWLLMNYLLTGKIKAMRRSKKDENWDAQRVRALRVHLKQTQARMADQLGMRQQTVSEWEQGQYQPRGASIKLLTIKAERSGFKYEAKPG